MGAKKLEEKTKVASVLLKWNELPHDLLTLIFRKVPILQRFTVAPLVCKSWAQALTDPYCWQEIDLFPWIDMNARRLRSTQLTHQREMMVWRLLPRSSGSLITLCVYGLGEFDALYNFIAYHGRSLRTLRIPESDISDGIVEQIAGRLSSLTFLDVSQCIFLRARGLVLIGNNCRQLQVLHMRMFYCFLNEGEEAPIYDDQAVAIAYTMPNLRVLDIGGHSFSTWGVHMILGYCSKLQLLSMWYCPNVDLQGLGLTINRFPNLTVWGPRPLDYFNVPNYNTSKAMLRIYEFLCLF